MRKIILDKSFIQAESQDCRRLNYLRDTDCVFVLTDTLIYELSSGANSMQWPAAQRKLFPFADQIEVWYHVGELLKQEIATKKPLLSPVNQEFTEKIRTWFRKGTIWVPPDLAEKVAEAKKQREIDTAQSAIKDSLEFSRINPLYTRQIQKGGAMAKAAIPEVINHKEIIAWQVRREHGNPDESDLYIPGAETGLSPEWFVYQNARSVLALRMVYMSKYGLVNTPGKDFIHTSLDSDYASLLHYADALATNETIGSLNDMRKWMYGDSKKLFSTDHIDASLPSHRQIELKAYQKWLDNGVTHGHHETDWFWAKRALAESIWN